jgi:hypothetical protein
METVMIGNSEDQVFNEVLWATPMPVMVLINSQVHQFRVKGLCSFFIDESLTEQTAQGKDEIISQVRSLLASAATDVLAISSRTISDPSELTAMIEEISSALRDKSEPEFNARGLKISKLEIHAIEGV